MSDEQRLIVSLEARVKDFEKKLATADKKMEKASRNIARAADRAGKDIGKDIGRGAQRAERSLNNLNRTGTRSLANLGNAARDAGMGLSKLQGVLAGAFAGASVGAMISKVKEATAAVAEMNREAKTAGLDTRTFQEFSYIARRFRVSQDALTDGFKELQLRADEFVDTAGKGSAADAFFRLGYSVDEIAAKLRDPIALFDEIIEKTRTLEKAAQIRIFD